MHGFSCTSEELSLSSEEEIQLLNENMGEKTITKRNCKTKKGPIRKKANDIPNLLNDVKAQRSKTSRLTRQSVRNVGLDEKMEQIPKYGKKANDIPIPLNDVKAQRSKTSRLTRQSVRNVNKKMEQIPKYSKKANDAQISLNDVKAQRSKTSRLTRKFVSIVDEKMEQIPKYKNQETYSNHNKKLNSKFSFGKHSKNVKEPFFENPDKLGLFYIQRNICEMRNKILKLKQKSELDEERIKFFNTVMMKKSYDDVVMLLDEPENEMLMQLDLLYFDYDPERVCKLCLQLFDKKGRLTSLLNNHSLNSIINSTLNMKVELDDGTPTGLCDDCLQQIKKYDQMKRRAHKAKVLSMKFVAMKKNLAESCTQEKTPKDEPFTLEELINEDNFMEEDQPMEGLMKIEDAFSLGTSTDTRCSNHPLDAAFVKEAPQDYNPSSVMRRKMVQTCSRCQTVFTNHWSLNKHHKYCSQKLKCYECDRCFFDSRIFRKHKLRRISCFSNRMLRCCVLCNKAFRWKWQLVFHVLHHK